MKRKYLSAVLCLMLLTSCDLIKEAESTASDSSVETAPIDMNVKDPYKPDSEIQTESASLPTYISDSKEETLEGTTYTIKGIRSSLSSSEGKLYTLKDGSAIKVTYRKMRTPTNWKKYIESQNIPNVEINDLIDYNADIIIDYHYGEENKETRVCELYHPQKQGFVVFAITSATAENRVNIAKDILVSISKNENQTGEDK